MPIYVYECDACHSSFEYTQSMSEPPMTVCEKCQGHLTKIIAPTAFVLKGGGWYKDLYSTPKSGGGENKSETPKSDSTKSETPSTPKPEKKD